MVAQWPVENLSHASAESAPLTLQLAPAVTMTVDLFFEFCPFN
jgi:hypothetical protein